MRRCSTPTSLARRGVLVNVIGGFAHALSEAEKVVEVIQRSVHPGSRIIWGATIDPALQHKMRCMAILTGVKSKQIFGPGEARRGKDVGIDVVK
jgi:cell division protein FtsZ